MSRREGRCLTVVFLACAVLGFAIELAAVVWVVAQNV